MRELQQICRGQPSLVGLHALPLAFENRPDSSDAELKAARQRLVAHYLSDPALGFTALRPRKAPGYLVAIWDAAPEPAGRLTLNRTIVEARIAALDAAGR